MCSRPPRWPAWPYDAPVTETVSIHRDPAERPTAWYNIVADLPTPPPPPLHPGTHQPVGPDDLAPLFPPELIAQEVTTERYVDIPGPVLDVYAQYRPSPLVRAHRWEQALGPDSSTSRNTVVAPTPSASPSTSVSRTAPGRLLPRRQSPSTPRTPAR